MSYTPWPVELGFEGERVRMKVGPVRSPQLRTYVFPRCALPEMSKRQLWMPCTEHPTCANLSLQHTLKVLPHENFFRTVQACLTCQ